MVKNNKNKEETQILRYLIIKQIEIWQMNLLFEKVLYP